MSESTKYDRKIIEELDTRECDPPNEPDDTEDEEAEAGDDETQTEAQALLRDFQEHLAPCQHELPDGSPAGRLNLATCTVDCGICGEPLLSLNQIVSPELRIRN